MPRLALILALCAATALCAAPANALTQGGSPSRIHLYAPAERYFNHEPAPSNVEIPEVCLRVCVCALPGIRRGRRRRKRAAANARALTLPAARRPPSTHNPNKQVVQLVRAHQRLELVHGVVEPAHPKVLRQLLGARDALDAAGPAQGRKGAVWV